MQLGFFAPQQRAPQAPTDANAPDLTDADRLWIDTRAPRFSFAASMQYALIRYGALTPAQLAAVRRLRLQDEERAAQRASIENAPAAEAGPLADAFTRAKAKGIKYPKLTLAGFVMSPAGEKSTNAGAIYVKAGRGYEATYLGKVLGNRFSRSRDCDTDTEARILAAIADPQAAAVAHGKQWGKCAVCNRDLTDAESVARGIGPVCAERMGWTA
jgi:hypothetical protein